MTISEDKEIVKLDNIKINNVGRLDSVIYNLNEFEIPTKVMIHCRFGHPDAPQLPM